MTARGWMLQFFGGLLLLLIVWGFLNTPDQRPWQVAVSALFALLALATATGLITANFVDALTRTPARMPRFFACLVVLLALLWLTGYLQDHSASTADWLASAFTMKRKKPVTPEAMQRVLDWMFFLVRWIVLPILLIPIAAGIRYRHLAPTWIILFLVGAVVPHYLIHWVPKVSGFWPQIASAGVRFFLAYALLISAWVLLGREARREVQS